MPTANGETRALALLNFKEKLTNFFAFGEASQGFCQLLRRSGISFSSCFEPFCFSSQVTLKSRELRDNYVTSYLQLKRMEDNLIREVTHLWYTSWPATGVPSEVRTVVALLLEARKGQSKDQPAPVVVHCR